MGTVLTKCMSGEMLKKQLSNFFRNAVCSPGVQACSGPHPVQVPADPEREH